MRNVLMQLECDLIILIIIFYCISYNCWSLYGFVLFWRRKNVLSFIKFIREFWCFSRFDIYLCMHYVIHKFLIYASIKFMHIDIRLLSTWWFKSPHYYITNLMTKKSSKNPQKMNIDISINLTFNNFIIWYDLFNF